MDRGTLRPSLLDNSGPAKVSHFRLPLKRHSPFSPNEANPVLRNEPSGDLENLRESIGRDPIHDRFPRTKPIPFCETNPMAIWRTCDNQSGAIPSTTAFPERSEYQLRPDLIAKRRPTGSRRLPERSDWPFSPNGKPDARRRRLDRDPAWIRVGVQFVGSRPSRSKLATANRQRATAQNSPGHSGAGGGSPIARRGRGDRLYVLVRPS